MNIALIGAGRIGQVHGDNIRRNGRARVTSVVDVDPGRAVELATRLGCETAPNAEAAVSPEDVDGVMICSSTDTHVEMIELAARYNKPIFCEKPIDLDLGKVDRCLQKVSEAAVPLLIGFNRRFDPHFSALKDALDAGDIGWLETLRITSRDPEPPPADYVTVSGGLFRDMTIHDFDMARHLLPEEPVEVFAFGSCLIDPAIGDHGDVDTAVVVLKTESGILCTIENSRRAVYGYDQRIEAFGANGMLTADNPTPTTLARTTGVGEVRNKPPWFFLERYAEAYRAELEHFISVANGECAPVISGSDGRAALVLAEAATRSASEGRPIRLD